MAGIGFIQCRFYTEHEVVFKMTCIAIVNIEYMFVIRLQKSLYHLSGCASQDFLSEVTT